MDVSKLLKTVNNLNDYIISTQEVINSYSNAKIQFNMSTVLSLKKIRSLEIEYFNKCDESGAGIRILELMLESPPSKSWSLLGKEIILLLQYWLEAIRKHLILHNHHWWNFLSVLLEFILKIHSKHAVLSNILVQELSECLLDLATNTQPSTFQRQKILQCFNTVCAESGREIRFALKNKFGHYFVKLSSILPICGDIRVQFCILDTLLRWLIPRQDIATKKAAAAKWFPDDFYNEASRCIFLERPWQNFFKDAREFLNCHNDRSDLVTTVVCRRFTIGTLSLIAGTSREYYLDLNSLTKCITLIVEPSLADVLGNSDSDAVVISKDNTNIIRMHRQSLQVFISINVTDPQLLYPSNVLEDNDIQIVVSSRSAKKLDRALRNIFGDKYELFMDLENSLPNSPNSDEQRNVNETRSSHAGKTRKKHCGYTVRPKHPVPWKSPSTASTSSLAMLRDKLTAFPSYQFDKEPVSVCALPQLSTVTEITEADRCSLNATLSTYKLRTYGVCNKKYITEKTPQIDNDDSVSCLLVATIGSNDSVINDTLERLPKDKEIHTDNIVELLAREALQIGETQKGKDEMPLIDKRSETDRHTYDVEAIEDFFSQHCGENGNDDLLISPSLARKINETSSEGSLDFDITNMMKDTINTNHCEIIHFDDTEVVECLNEMVDKVCEDLDKFTEYFNKENAVFNTSDKPKEASLEEIHDDIKRNTKQKVRNLRLRISNRKKSKKQTKLVTESDKRMTTIVERDSEVEKSSKKSSDCNKDQSVLETPTTKRKRKLYSPKTESGNIGIHVSETEDDHSLLTAPMVDFPRNEAMSYKDIRKIRRISVRKLRNQTCKMNLSPKSQKLNEMFDNLKNSTENNEKIQLANRKISTRKLAVYNFSSDNEEEDFRSNVNSKKKIISPKAGKIAKSTRVLRSRDRKRNNTGKTNSQVDNQKTQKTIKREKKLGSKKAISEPKNEMIDERMREAATELLNTSLIEVKEKDSNKELEPVLNFKPEMEVINEDTNKKPSRRKRMLSLKRDKNKTSDKDQSTSSSPLPGLIIETVDVQVHKRPDDSITGTMLQKFKDIYDKSLPEISEINTTHNLLSDLDPVSYDPILNMTDELKNTSQRSKKRSRSDEKHNDSSKGTKSPESVIINISEVSERKSEKSIETLGKSPITGHGIVDESPPNPVHLNQTVEPRGLETQDFSQSLKNYFDTLTKDIYEESHTSNKRSNDSKALKSNKSTVSPTVSIQRLSQKEMNRWLPPKYNSIFGSTPSSDSEPVRITRSYTRSQEQQKINGNSSKIETRRSAISPIKMFGEVKDKSIQSEDFVDHIKKLMTRKPITQTSRNSKVSKTEIVEKMSTINSTVNDSIQSNGKSSPVFELYKRKTESRFDFESGQGSSVNHWFKKNEYLKRSKAESVELSLKDNLEHVLDKIDTTLTEIHNKTSNRFVNMFVGIQSSNAELKQRRHQLYKETAVAIISDIVNVMDKRFTDLERRCQELDDEFINSLKNKASDLMREDCKQKKVMVNLMKEDVQAVLDNINK